MYAKVIWSPSKVPFIIDLKAVKLVLVIEQARKMLVVDCQEKSLQLLLTEGSQTCTGYRASTEDASCRLSGKIPPIITDRR